VGHKDGLSGVRRVHFPIPLALLSGKELAQDSWVRMVGGFPMALTDPKRKESHAVQKPIGLLKTDQEPFLREWLQKSKTIMVEDKG